MTSAPVLKQAPGMYSFKLVGSVRTPSLWEVVLIFVYGPSSLATWAAASRTSTSTSTGRIPTPVGVGILQAHFNLHEPFACFLLLSGETSTRMEFYFTFMQQALLHAAKKWSGRARVSHQPGFFFIAVSSLCLYPQSGESKARDPLLRSTKGEGGVCGGQSVSRFP